MHLPSLVLLVAGLLGPPTVTSLSPSSVTAGSAGFTLTVNGTGFRRNAVVRWNGAHRPTTWVSETTLEAAITAADIAQPGTVQVAVLTRGAKGGQSSPLPFTVGVGAAATPAGAIPNNPVPSVASVTPASALAGGESFRLVLSGGGFAPGAVLRWNGAARPTTRHSSTMLSAVIDRADIAAVGSARVSVLNPTPGGGPSADHTVRILHQSPVVSSLAPATVPAGSADLVVTLAGRNFIRSAVAYWNNAPRVTQFVGPTAVRMTVTAADLRAAGAAQVTLVTTVEQSSMRSAPVPFTVSLPPQITVTATPQLVLGRFHVGGEGNPAWVTAGQTVPLYALVTGVAPTHWRAGESAQLTGVAWRTATGAPTWTFPPGTTGNRTLWYQVRFGDGAGAVESAIVSDVVEVVPPYSTVGVTSEAFGFVTTEHIRMECPPGQVLTGIHGASGAWLDNVGPLCGGGASGPYAYTAVYGGLVQPERFNSSCPFAYAPGEIGLYKSFWWEYALGRPVISCPPAPSGIGTGYQVARAVAVGGRRTDSGVECPDGAFPVGLDVWLMRGGTTGARGVSALGLICARLRP